MSNITTHVRRNLRLLDLARQVPRRILPQKIKTELKKRFGQYIPGNPASSYRDRAQAKVDARQGHLAGNLHFWQVRPNRDWAEVQARLFTLADLEQDEVITDFLQQYLRFGGGQPHLCLLSRSGLSRHFLARLLQQQNYARGSEMADRIGKSMQFTADLAAAALYLLDADAVSPLLKRIIESYPSLPPSYHSLLDSHVLVPSARPGMLQGTVPASATRKPARHRLIITDSLRDPVRLSLLFADADKVTLFSPRDLYGKISLADHLHLHFRPQEITVAHPRSRITRFSSRYHELHDETRQIASDMIAELEQMGDDAFAGAAPYAALHLADALFFEVLRCAAFEDFVTSDEFDQIVIATTGKVDQAEFFLNLASGVDLTSDPRIEFTALVSNTKARTVFPNAVTQALTPTGIAQPGARNVDALARPLNQLLRGARAARRPQAAQMHSFPAKPLGNGTSGEQPRVLFVTTHVGAYNASSAEYLDILSRHYNTLTGFIGSNALTFFRALPASIVPPPASAVQLLNNAPVSEIPGLALTLQNFVAHTRERLLREGRGRLTAHVLGLHKDEVALRSLRACYHHWIRLQNWFDELQKTGQLPDLVVATPLRPPLVGMAAAAARQHLVPSLALEPHGLNRTYCRYSLVGTDRYGVITSYFRDEAAHGFAIAADRIDVIGSPRLKAPKDHDPVASQLVARQAITEKNGVAFAAGETVITFFTQPSSWAQIAEVWDIILRAVRDLPATRLLLKLHPEEGETRATGYLAIAEALGMAGRVDTITATPIESIEAADLVLACYSATVTEAAMYRKPVFCVINGAGDYPLDQHAVVGAPLLRDVAGLRAEIAGFKADPAPYIRQAERFLEREPQIVSGPEQPLVAAVDAMLARTPAQNIRPSAEMPPHLFIEGPYRVFDI